jgi:hypothetical protein
VSRSQSGESKVVSAEQQRGAHGERSVTLRMDGFAWEAIEQQCDDLGVPVEDFIAFSALYYLADIDSGRVSRQIARSPYPGTS